MKVSSAQARIRGTENRAQALDVPTGLVLRGGFRFFDQIFNTGIDT